MAKRKTKDQFVEEATKVHGNKYDYSKVEYFSTHQKVEIICYEHGVFLQTPNKHINGRNCPDCASASRIKNKRLTKEEILSKFREVHKGKYKYEDFSPEGVRNKIIITCPIHGKFEQEIFAHSQGKGCKQCGIDKISDERRKFTTVSFIEHCRGIHGYKYDYSMTEYVSATKQVDIICPDHGKFSQTGQAHYQGHGCPECGIINRWYIGGFGDKVKYYQEQQISDEPCHLYLVKLSVQGEDCYKIGITTKDDPKARFNSIKYESKADKLDVLFCELLTVTKAYKIEQHIKKHFYDNRHKPKTRFFGWTECISGTSVESIIKEIKEKVNA